MVAGSSALETTEQVTAKVRRKGAVFSSLGLFMERTFPSHLVSRSLDHDKSQQLQNLRHGYIGPELPKIDPWHGKLNKNREEEPVIFLRTRRTPEQQYAQLG